MPIYEIDAPDGKTYEIEGPAGASKDQIVQALLQKFPYAAQTTEALKKAPSAPTSLKDIALAVGAGGAGGIQALTDIFGAGNVASEALSGVQKSALEAMTPERQQEMMRREEIKRRAKTTGEEVSAYLGGFTEAPLQTTLGALSSSAPIIAAGLLPGGQAAAGASIATRAAAAARAAAPTGIGALMGLGGQKGQDYEVVKQALLDKNVPPQEAEELAKKASEFGLENLPRQAAAFVAGALEGRFGAEGVLSRYLAKKGADNAAAGVAKAPTWSRAIGQSVMGESAPEAVQAAVGQVGTNIALTQAGIPTELSQGLAGTVAHDALVGAALGLGVSPAQKANLMREFVESKAKEEREKREAFEKERAEYEKAYQEELAKTREQLGVKTEMLALPAPAKEAKPEEDLFQEPLGRIKKNELAPEVAGYIDEYRKANNLPALKDYSIEDVRDAMTQVNPEGEKAALDSIIAAKTGFKGEEQYTVDDVLNVAARANVDTNTRGFKDFLARATGESDLNAMSQPQLFAAFSALNKVGDRSAQETQVLPEGSNASRFTEDQLNEGLTLLGKYMEQSGGRLTEQQAVDIIKAQTDLKEDRDAKALLRSAQMQDLLYTQPGKVYTTVNRAGEVTGEYATREQAEAEKGARETVQEAQGRVYSVSPEAAQKETLPAGYELEEREVEAGEAPAEVQITPEGRGKPIARVPTMEEVQGKIERLTGLRQQEAAKTLGDIQKYEETISKAEKALESMEARGEEGSEGYNKAQARLARMKDVLGRRMKALYDRVEEFSAPLKAKPVGKKRITRKTVSVKKDGKVVGTYPDRATAIESILTEVSDKELEELSTKGGTLGDRAAKTLEERKKPGVRVKGTKEGLEKAGVDTTEYKEKVKALDEKLRQMLDKFGLKDVRLKIVRAVANGNADGEFSGVDKLIQIAFNAGEAVQTLRHEALHALKNFGFFTPQQWKVLENRAKTEWVDEYLKKKNVEVNGKVMSRYDAYANGVKDENGKYILEPLTPEAILEEAIADAFADYAVGTKPPAGLIQALFNKLQQFFKALRSALTGAGFESAEEIFGKIEAGELVPEAEVSNPNSWKATKADLKKAEEYFEENGIMPYTSEGQLTIPLEGSGTKFSIKMPYTQKEIERSEQKAKLPPPEGKKAKKVKILKNDPITGLPLNQNGTVTLYYPTTNEGARELARTKKLRGHSPTSNRIYLTNESGANIVADNPGMIDQPVGGANVLLQVDPSLLELAQEYDDGRKDFYIPIAEGQEFAKKMRQTKLFTLNAPRTKGLHADRSLSEVSESIEKIAKEWASSDKKTQDKMFKDAKDVLMSQHNVSTLFGANAKLEKTNIGEYGLTYKGKNVISTGLGFASAQKISDKRQETTCPKSAICEALCLGETSGQNELYGGEGPFRSGPRLSQFLKTEAFIVNPEAFTISLIRQIEGFIKAAKEVDHYPSIRLNVTSDFPGSMFKPIMEMFPDVMFYDYTKLITAKPVAPNHHLTYSSTGASQVLNPDKPNEEVILNKESNWNQLVNKVLNEGKNVAMAFTSRTDIPSFVMDERTGQKFEVWNGDEYDARFLDPKRPDGVGWIIGLTNKDRTTSPEESAKKHNGFFLDYDKERDGDTLVIRDQNKLAGKPEKKTFPITPVNKFSLRKAPDTPEFKQFFGKSKVVDKEGKPKFMYHGLAKDTTDFTRKTARGAPIFLTDDPKFAERFAYDSYESIAKNPEGFLNDQQIADGRKKAIAAIRKDYGKDTLGREMISSIESGNPTVEAKEYLKKQFIDMLPVGPHVMKLWVRAENPFDYENPRHISRIKEEVELDEDDLLWLKNGNWETIEQESVQEAIKMAGFDSFYVKEHGRKNLAVYEPNQVKSATGNVGTFSRESSDVRYSLRNVAFPSVKEAQEAADDIPVPDTFEFKQYMDGNQWVDEDGKAKKFFHATVGDFFDFKESPIYLSETAKDSEKFGRAKEDNLRAAVYRALNKSEKLPLFQAAVDKAVESGKITVERGEKFMRDAKRSIPDFDRYPSIKEEVDAELIALAPERMNIMPLYAKSMNPFDFRNPQHVAMVAANVSRGDLKISEQAMKMVREMNAPSEYPDHWYRSLPGRLKEGFTKTIEDKRVQDAIRALNFDGFISRKSREAPLTYAVYDPSQVKSVTANNGEFDIAKSDVRRSLKRSTKVLPQISQAEDARLNRITQPRERKGWAQRLMNSIGPKNFDYFRQRSLDRYNELSVIDKLKVEKMGGKELLGESSAHNMALLSDLSSGVTASAIGFGNRSGGIPVFRNGATVIDSSVKGLGELLSPLAEYEDSAQAFQRLQFVMAVKRGTRLDAQGKNIGITDSDRALAEKFKREMPELEQVANDFIKWNNGVVQYQVDTGVLSPEMAEEYRKYADYIPFYRQMEGEDTIGPKLFHAIGGVKKGKKLKGGSLEERPIGDFLETVIRNTQSAINAGMKNAAAQTAAKNAVFVGLAEKMEGIHTGPEYFQVMENGKQVSYRTADALLIDALSSLNMSELPFLGILSEPSNWLRNLVTKDPAFMMANVLRDSLSAWVTSGAKMTPIAGTVSNFAKALKGESPAFKALLDAGVIGGYEFSDNLENSGLRLERDLNKKYGKAKGAGDKALRAGRTLWEALEKGTTASDAATRMIVYEQVMAETGNEVEALIRSLEVMNFNRKGSSPIVRILTAAVPFLNARMQGLDLFYRAGIAPMFDKNATEREKAVQRAFWTRGMLLASTSLMYFAMVHDDDEWKKQEQENKDNNWIIPQLGIRIPIPFEVGVLFKVVPERIAAATFGNDTGQDTLDSLKRNLWSTFGLNPIPQAFKPIVEVATNYNFFTGRKIIGQGMEDVDSAYQTGPGTSRVAEAIAGMIGASPMKVDHLIKGYTGSIGMYITDMADMVLDINSDSPKASKRFEQLPIIKRFAVDPEARGNVTAYYELKDASDVLVRTMNLLEKSGKPEEFADYVSKNVGLLANRDYVLDLEKEMKALREMKQTIRSLSVSGDEKRDMLVEIGRMENNLTANIQEVKKTIASMK